MHLNGSDAYLPVHNDSPFIIVVGGAKCGKSKFIERAYAEPFQDDVDRYVNRGDMDPLVTIDVDRYEKKD